MVIEINKDIDRYQESVAMGLTAKQLVFSIASVIVGGGIVLLLYRYIGLTGSAYVAIPCVAPIALGGFYSFNGMNFYEYMGKKLHFMFGNKALTYVSTEGEPAIKAFELEQNGQVKKKGKKTESEITTSEAAVKKQEEFEEMKKKTGNYYGINQISKNVNIGNRKKLINGNGFVFGVPGSGKSFFCKMEMGSVFLSGDDEIIVIDPMNEYFDIAETYGGTVVNMSTYTDNYVNPLEMDVWSLDPNDSKGMVREKGEFMLGLCEQCIGDSLNSRQKSIIDRCVRKLYIDIARSREKYIPIMSDFYDILMAQPEEEAKDIALSLELFVNGSLNIFNHQTNVDVDNRFTVYGIRDLGTELSPITMLVMMEAIQNRIVENGKRGKATWLYIDEFHVLLNSEYSAKYLQQLWKKVRKQGGLCTGITQNVVDLLQNYTATTMLANSEFVALLKQANTDSSKMAEVIGVSEAQLRFVTNTASGMGLIKCGSVVIPFDNQISKDTDLYKLYNTNIHEKIAEAKKRENQRKISVD